MAKKLVLFGCGGTGENICVKIAEIIATQNWQKDEKPKFVLIDTHGDNLKERGTRIQNATSEKPCTIQLKYDRVRQLLNFPDRTDVIPKLASCGLTNSTNEGKRNIKYIKGLLAAGADDNGARREPALGRLSMIAEWSDIREKIRNEIEAISRGIDGETLQCYVFSSSFGGTGAGIFIPLMYLLRKRFGNDVKIKLWLLDPSYGNVVHEGVSEEERERFYRNGYRILRELDYIQSGVTEKMREVILPYKTNNPEDPNKNLYGIPESKFDSVLLFSRFLQGSLNNIEYAEALERISEAFLQVVNMPNQIDENPGDFAIEGTSKYESASTGLRTYASCSCGKRKFPQSDWSALLCKVKEADLYEKALQSQNNVEFDAFPGESAFKSTLSAIEDDIKGINRKLHIDLDNFSIASSEASFSMVYKESCNKNGNDLHEKINNWFNYIIKLAKREGRKNIVSASSILKNALNQVKTFKTKLGKANFSVPEPNPELKDAVTRRYGGFRGHTKKNNAIEEYLDNYLYADYRAKARKECYVQCLKIFDRQNGGKSGVEQLEDLYNDFVNSGKNLTNERNSLRQQIEEEKKRIFRDPLVQKDEFDKAEKGIKEFNGTTFDGVNFAEPAYVLTDSTQKRNLKKSLEKYCFDNSKGILDRLDSLLAPTNSGFIEEMEKFRNSCEPLFSYVKGRGYDTDCEPERSSYIFCNLGNKEISKLPPKVGNIFYQTQLVNSPKLQPDEIVYLTYLKGLRPDFSPCYYEDFETAYKKQLREFQGSLEGRLDEFAKAANELFKDFGPKEAEAPSEIDVDK